MKLTKDQAIDKIIELMNTQGFSATEGLDHLINSGADFENNVTYWDMVTAVITLTDNPKVLDNEVTEAQPSNIINLKVAVIDLVNREKIKANLRKHAFRIMAA